MGADASPLQARLDVLAEGADGSGMAPLAYWSAVLAPLLLAARRSLGDEQLAGLLRAAADEERADQRIEQLGRMPGG